MNAFSLISELLSKQGFVKDRDLEEALASAKFDSRRNYLIRFGSSAEQLLPLYNWLQERPDYEFSVAVLNGMVDSLAKDRQFDSAWRLILDQVQKYPNRKPDSETFAIMIRRYSGVGLPWEAIRTFEYACSLDLFHDFDSQNKFLELLLSSLCKEGNAGIALQYFDKQKANDPSFEPSIRLYNILLKGCFRLKEFSTAENLLERMKKENIRPSMLTYEILVNGFCRMRSPERAMELFDEMKEEGFERTAMVYNPIIDALCKACRFKEALGMLERFSILEKGPTVSTYNSLVMSFCESGDLVEACKILKMMIYNECFPTSRTYGYFFRYFSKEGMVDLSLNLYTKMMRSGYEPDRQTYHLIVKMLCKAGELDPAERIIKEMRSKRFDLNMATRKMLFQLLWRSCKYYEAVSEFENMLKRGFVPQHQTYVQMIQQLKKHKMTKTVRKLDRLMRSFQPDTTLESSSYERTTSILLRAEAISDAIKDRKKLSSSYQGISSK
ncbi:hypothetical protein M569_03518 [Genlisea aurea]|uniref:Pentacotripeptide-repeat region of PRORP domain-containing protein n=1 Tax=Genlisea aurea TaxID=192259 RepID=S8EFA1_9LAMI|nr:hypothetical protein M569_03518 [Genlisea aurea]